MIEEKQTKAISKFLSYILRHEPAEAGITLDKNGWTDVSMLLKQLGDRFPTLNKSLLEYIVATNSKQRFAFNEDKTMIRASQGHSLDVELNYLAQEPPMVLFHGTAQGNVNAIMQEGLKKQSRHHVHLSENVLTALQVGSRHGRPVVLKIHAGKMHEAGYTFYVSANHVWLTDFVPAAFIEDEF
jgi:putative RNA 2'-phosphotransferase